MKRIVHYLNQHFGGIGGEDKAHVGCQSRPGPVGPGNVLQSALGGEAQIVGTIICGDNYFAENIEQAAAEVVASARPFQPDLVLAGPALAAGRYGIACAETCKAIQRELKIPSLTGMFAENPGVELCREDVYVLQTSDSVRGLAETINRMARFALRMLRGEEFGPPATEGYFPRGLLVNESVGASGAERALDLLLQKVGGQPYVSEVPRLAYDRVPPASPIQDLSQATIALVTDGGLVPKGNPDRIEIRAATRFGRYDIAGMATLVPDGYEVAHEGYASVTVRNDPNRLVPVDTSRQLEREGRIRKLHDFFYSTTGVACVVEVIRRLGVAIANDLKASGVSGVVLTST
jgi:glycine reductase